MLTDFSSILFASSAASFSAASSVSSASLQCHLVVAGVRWPISLGAVVSTQLVRTAFGTAQLAAKKES